jgi:uncharacterized protein (TIGR01244 family)
MKRDVPMLDIRQLTADYAVAPQISLDAAQRIKALGFTDVINNRPDAEITPDIQTQAMRAAIEAAGMVFHANPVIGGAITPENVHAQSAVIAQAKGPVLAYCASGNRSSIVWALAHAGARPADELISIAAQHGYNLEHLRRMLQG